MIAGIPPFRGEKPERPHCLHPNNGSHHLYPGIANVSLKNRIHSAKGFTKKRAERNQTIKEMLAGLRNLKKELNGSAADQSACRVYRQQKIKRHKRGRVTHPGGGAPGGRGGCLLSSLSLAPSPK